jgi:Mg2+ and Co2+ transporter CorA
MTQEFKNIKEDLLKVKQSFDTITTQLASAVEKIEKINKIEDAIVKKTELEELKNTINSGSFK